MVITYLAKLTGTLLNLTVLILLSSVLTPLVNTPSKYPDKYSQSFYVTTICPDDEVIYKENSALSLVVSLFS